MKPSTSSRIRGILEELSSIRSMERGKLSEFYRSRPAPKGGGTLRIGPYYKLQAWEEGRNRTRYVPAGALDELKGHLANHQRFKQLVADLEQTIIAETRAAKTREKEDSGPAGEAKKNSAKKRSPKNTGKPKASWPGPGGD